MLGESKFVKNILITGGAGFIGSNIALKLNKLGFNVTVMDNLSEQIHGENPYFTSELFQSIKDQVSFVKGDVTVKNDLINVIKGQDAIIHLAAETGTGQSMYEINRYTEMNIGGTALLLDILANLPHTIKKIVVASSRAIYGEGRYYCKELGYVYPQARIEDNMKCGKFECTYPGTNEPLELVSTTEDSKIHPTSVYGITKQVQEQLIMTVCPTISIQPVSLRYQNVYGPGQSLSNPYTGILSIFSTRIKNGNEINIFEDGNESRDFIFIDDVVDATIKSLVLDSANNQVFNVGSGVPTNVLKVAKTLINSYNSNVRINISGNYRLGDIRHNFADISKAKELLGFIPKWTFDKGIEMFTQWVESQKINSDKYEDSILEMKQRGLFK